jgi:hypothetical protein
MQWISLSYLTICKRKRVTVTVLGLELKATAFVIRIPLTFLKNSFFSALYFSTIFSNNSRLMIKRIIFNSTAYSSVQGPCQMTSKFFSVETTTRFLFFTKHIAFDDIEYIKDLYVRSGRKIDKIFRSQSHILQNFSFHSHGCVGT